MSCRRDRLYDRLYGLLDESEAAELDLHIAGCADCRDETATLKRRDGLLDAWTPEYRPARPVRMTRRAVPAWAVAAAAFLVVLLTTMLFPAPDRYAVEGGSATSGTAMLTSGTELSPDVTLRTTEGASLRLGRAGRVRLEPQAEIHFKSGGRDLDHDLELAAGRIHVEVFPTGRPFRVRVGERTVEVRGTRFTVERLGGPDLAALLGEESMKRWQAASVSIALVTVTSGSVVLVGPEGRHPVEAGRSVLATPTGIQKVDSGESLATIRKVRDELVRSLAEREEKNRAAGSELDALQSKQRKLTLPPGATLETLLAGLREAHAAGDWARIRECIQLLGLLIAKDASAIDGVFEAIRSTRDLDLVGSLCSALWENHEILISRRGSVLKLFVSDDLPADLRLVAVQSLWALLNGHGRLDDQDCVALYRAARTLSGEGAPHQLRKYFTALAGRFARPGSESWTELQRYLVGETDEKLRLTALKSCFHYAAQQRSLPEVEALLLDALRGTYGASVAADQVSQAMVRWFTADNGEAFSAALGTAGSLLRESAQRQAVAGQLALLTLLHGTPAARDALRRLHAAEPDPAARTRMGEVLEGIEQGNLDLDKLMEKLQLRWEF